MAEAALAAALRASVEDQGRKRKRSPSLNADMLRATRESELQARRNAKVRAGLEADTRRAMQHSLNNTRLQNAIARSMRNQGAGKSDDVNLARAVKESLALMRSRNVLNLTNTQALPAPVIVVTHGAIAALLSPGSLWMITDVRGDGNCFWHALQGAMAVPSSPQELREQARIYAMTSPIGHAIDRSQFSDGVWAEEGLITLVAQMLRIRLVIFQSAASFADCLGTPTRWDRISGRVYATHIFNPSAFYSVYMLNVGNNSHFMTMAPARTR